MLGLIIALVISIIIVSLIVSLIAPIVTAIILIVFEDGTKRTIRLLLIPFGFIVILKDKYKNLEED